jgi:hypothetical protein
MSKQDKRSRATLIRDAVGEHLSRRPLKRPAAAFGLWRKRELDGLAYQETIRDEWKGRPPGAAGR